MSGTFRTRQRSRARAWSGFIIPALIFALVVCAAPVHAHSAGRLVLVKQDRVTVGQYGYDWTGRRVTRDTLGAGPTSRDYIYDIFGRLAAEYDGPAAG